MSIPYNIFDTLPRDCWTTIDVVQLAENIRRLKTLSQRPVLALVKANAYGHGYEIAARAFLTGGAEHLGIATVAEGILLRQMGFTCPILVICGLLPAEMAVAVQAGLDIFVWRLDQIEALRSLADKASPVRVHLKVDTGMGRGGCNPEDVVEMAKALQAIEGIELTGLCTHFASADVVGIDDTDKQIKTFDLAIDALTSVGIRPRIIHAANSAGALYFDKSRYDMVRVGITAYGVPPDDGLSVPEGVKTALTWHARIISTKILPVGHGVSYGSEHRLEKPQRIGVIPVGYGDGFRRTTQNSVLVEGQERKVLGRVCMDQCMIDLDGFGDLTGAEVLLLGKQGDKSLSPHDLARRWGTNPYEVYTGIAARVPRKIAA